MQSSQVATRLTCFAVLSAIEQDLRDVVANGAKKAGVTELLTPTVREATTKRFAEANKHNPERIAENDFDLLDYTDFGDLSGLLVAHSEALWQFDKSDVKQIAKAIGDLAPARNRVCHSRPLEPDDFAGFLDLADTLLAGARHEHFPSLAEATDRLRRNPSFVLKLTIPDYWQSDLRTKPNNLPPPEFDDTGFLGRTTDRSELKRLLLSNHPVITLVGEGGVGKTALASRCLYDLLDQGDDLPYGAIIWVTLKAKVLTAQGAVDLKGAISSTLGITEAISSELALPDDTKSLDERIVEIVEYMRIFKTLLVIDNLETLKDSNIRALLSSVPAGAKVLITSRIGLGELELRYPIQALDDQTAGTLLRRFSKVLRLSSLASATPSAVSHYCSLLYNNPLLIKWFVSSTANGSDPGKLLARRGAPFGEVLRFCFENLFERLTANERGVLHVLASARRPLSSGEVYYIAHQQTREEVDWALSTLHRSGMLKLSLQEVGANELPVYMYALTDIASQYIATVAPPPPPLFATVQKRLSELRTIAERDEARKDIYKYDAWAIRATTIDQRLAAAFLKRAQQAFRRDNLPAARKAIDEARSVAPTFAEVYRISGMIESASDPYRAASEFDTALGFDPRSAIVRYVYANFLIRYATDYDAALTHLAELEKTDPDDLAVVGLKGIALTRLSRFAEASAIYDRMLKSLATRNRKWRVQSYDQAAECFRRWGEKHWKLREYREAGLRLQRSLAILEEALAAGDWDDRSPDLTLQVLDEWMRSSVHGRDTHFVDQIVSALTRLTGELRRSGQRFHYAIEFAEACVADREMKASVLEANRQVGLHHKVVEKTSKRSPSAKARYALGDRLTGKIRNLPMGLPYAFIEDEAGESWFFHRSFLVDPKVWARLNPGDRVQFVVGQNDGGPCAREVARVATGGSASSK